MKFRMLDHIDAWQPRRSIRGVKAVSFEEYELRERLGDEPCLPESLVVESLFQLASWLVILSTDYTQMAMATGWEEIRFPGRLRPGRRLHMAIDVCRWSDDRIEFDASASDGAQSIVTACRLLGVPVPLADYHDPADLRVWYEELHPGEPLENDEAASCPA